MEYNLIVIFRHSEIILEKGIEFVTKYSDIEDSSRVVYSINLLA